jgi:hypothetical protein
MDHPFTDLTFPFAHPPFAFRYLWVFFLFMGLVNCFLGWRSVMAHIKDNAALRVKYRQLFILYVIWTNLPWVVMGLGILFGGAAGVLDFLVPASGNTTVMVWWGLFFVMNFSLAGWVLFGGGAETLEKYPGLPTLLSGSAANIKIVVSVAFIFINCVAAILYFFNPWAHDGKAYSTRVLLDFPLFFSLFCVFFWLLGGWLIARFGGWDDLAKAYGSEQLYEGSYLRWRSAKLNHIHYHTCLDLGADSEGLHLSMNYLFKVHHRDLFIPWAEIKASRSQMIWGPTIVLQFEKVPKVSLEFHEKTISALKEMANTSVAFKDLT